MSAAPRIGIDLGGTKISGVALDAEGRTQAHLRTETPHGDYDATLQAIAELVAELEGEAGAAASVGVGTPGSLSPASGRMQNANSTWLNGKPLDRDLSDRLARPVRCANDANCFALSEAVDGAGAEAASVFGVILGTGCGGGFVTRGRLVDGPRGIGGEWGHNPLPWPEADERPGPACWCGQQGCMETWVSGPALTADHERVTGSTLTAEDIATAARAGDAAAEATLARHAGRLARGLATVVNMLDPDVIVLGGGLSHMAHLYDRLPALIGPRVFADDRTVSVRPPRHGDDSGARGAAWLWGGPGASVDRTE